MYWPFDGNRCHRDACTCFPGYCVSRTHIPRDASFPSVIHVSSAHISLGMRVPGLQCNTYIARVRKSTSKQLARVRLAMCQIENLSLMIFSVIVTMIVQKLKAKTIAGQVAIRFDLL